MTDQYLSADDLRFALGHPDAEDEDPLLEQAIDAASRQIDKWAGGQFWADASPTARLFYPVNRYLVDVGFFSTTAGMVVETDETGDGTYEVTWTSSQWRPWPANPINSYPYSRVVATTPTRLFPVNGRSPCVRVTAAWGWGEVPGAVRQACQVLAVIYYRSKDFTGGDVGFNVNIETNNPASPFGLAFRLVRDLVGKAEAPTRGPTNNLVESLTADR